jgi:hypothetical protein
LYTLVWSGAHSPLWRKYRQLAATVSSTSLTTVCLISIAVSNQPSPLCGGHHQRGVVSVSLFYLVISNYTLSFFSQFQLRNPTCSPSHLSRSWVFSYSLLILYHIHRALSSLYSIFLSVIGKGIEPYPTNEYHLSTLSNLLVI